jgi:hypothetical protein
MSYEGLKNIQIPTIPTDVSRGTIEWMEAISNVIQELGTNAYLGSYDTGWINRSDWSDVQMGSVTIKNTNSNVNHKLKTNLSDLLVRVLISTDGTDANSFEVLNSWRRWSTDADVHFGCQPRQVDKDNIIIHTGTSGFRYIKTADGNSISIGSSDWYYKIKVYKIR